MRKRVRDTDRQKDLQINTYVLNQVVLFFVSVSNADAHVYLKTMCTLSMKIKIHNAWKILPSTYPKQVTVTRKS